MSDIMKVLKFLSKKQREFKSLNFKRTDLYPLVMDFYEDSFVISISKKDEFLKNIEVDEVCLEFFVASAPTCKVTNAVLIPFSDNLCKIPSFETDKKYINFSNDGLEALWLDFCTEVVNM